MSATDRRRADPTEGQIVATWAGDIKPCEECGTDTNGWHYEALTGRKRFCCGECCEHHIYAPVESAALR